MNAISPMPRYGIREQIQSETEIDKACESLKLLGYAVVDGGYTAEQMSRFSEAFDNALEKIYAKYGRDALAGMDEQNTIRILMLMDPLFLDLAMNRNVLEVCQRLIGGTVMLNQQNGVINPPLGERYNQGAYHRDLPYQHFVSTRPLAINALFCLDQFTTDNGATFVVPASHKQEEFPSDLSLRDLQLQMAAPAGSFIVLDCMLYHVGGVNRTTNPRRAVNHVYTIPLIKQQISLPTALGDDFTTDAAARSLLGYSFQVPENLDQYFATRKK
ncbi:phytanoyl-CoA dioxygenase family protein [Agrobacterium genomosp. 3 str. CIP 111-78]|uniref:Phytanoyl-CoA dioxygenase family protein n=2 Tax=Pseudomonadota TaxID=1224 RepID=A0AAE6EMC8_AGRTU|nr:MULTISPECIES: phytanoyl-CoA dioxygenase family protein [Agrobacterium tumefaciens complex]MCA2371571.1 phytanoyl-CoA dioxygenase family protein [Agrobacterium tomkonis CIP 111-78]QCM03078.1 phytanoyl-CoA dioxygenase family protein [Agrobacterium tumefaciens]